jgi:hypothetical protein
VTTGAPPERWHPESMAAFNIATSMRNFARNSPWLVIAIMIHVLLFAALSVVYVAKHFVAKQEKPVAVAISKPQVKAEDITPPPPEVIDRKAVPKNTDAEIVSFEEETFTPLSAPAEDEDLHLDRGDPNAVDNLPPGATGGTSIGTGGVGHYGTGVPSGFATRRAGGGGRKGRSGGETSGTEAAVLEGMRWLIRHQNEDGSWGADTLLEHCSTKAQCVSDNQDFSPHYNPGLTALSLLAFLGAGFQHDSKNKIVDTAMGKRYVVGDVVGKGIKWLISEQGPDGSFANYSGNIYNEALGALALSEAYGLSQNPALKEPAEKLINYLVFAQKSNPTSTGRWGWRYTPGGDSVADTSVTAWVVMAFKSAQIAGLKVPQQSFEGAMDFATWVTGENGLVGYLDPAGAGQAVTGRNDHFDYHVGTMSSLGMIIRTFVKHDIDDPFLELAAGQIVKDVPRVSEDHLSVDYYYWYYGTLALNQFDGPDSPRKSGKFWDPWNKAMQEGVLSLQDKNNENDICSRGGWLVGDRWSYEGGPIYCTAINVLTLEVYYRYANAFGGAKHN